jgi:site-specific DNA-methyltransferase (adenine-specific)
MPAVAQSTEWETPQAVFDQLNSEFQFTLDPCATPANAKCARFFTAAEDGLKQRWGGAVFCNPPYGPALRHWMRKAFEESQLGAIVVCLVPSRTDTRWWHDYVEGKAEVRFLRGRLYYGAGTGRAPFPSCVVVFRP